MKKKILMVIAFIMLFIGVITVNAAGPESDGYIKVTVGVNSTYLYGTGQTIGTVTGLSYNSNTNTLTMNNYNNTTDNSYIAVYKMGDLSVNVVGTNNMKCDYGYCIYNGMNKDDAIKTILLNGSGTLNLTGNLGASKIENVTINIGDNSILTTHSIKDSVITLGEDSLIYTSHNTLKIKDSTITGEDASIDISTGNINIENSNINLNYIRQIDDYGDTSIFKNSIITANSINIQGNSTTIEGGTYTLGPSTSPDVLYSVGLLMQGNIKEATINIENVGIGIQGDLSLTDTSIKMNNVIVGLMINPTAPITGGSIDITCAPETAFNSYLAYVNDNGDSYAPKYSSAISFMVSDSNPISEDLKIFEGGQLKNYCDEELGACIYYISKNGEEATIDFEGDDPFVNFYPVLPKRLLIRDKNWTPTTTNNTTETITNVPDTLNNKIVFIIVGTLVVAAGAVVLVKMKKNDKKTK